jgi:uncharacterized membrane protein YdjX (TVP38/TMEM64 family)
LARTDVRTRWRILSAGALVLLAGWAAISYRGGGFVYALFHATGPNTDALAVLRRYLAGWGPLAPFAYFLLVVVEVLVAPLPGTLLYAPGGALFGGFVGGTVSLAGNVVGATIACALAGAWGGTFARTLEERGLARYRERIAARGVWIILLLRINPLTSSDLVSYAAGLAGVARWRVALGTLAGMAPLCYAQAYLAERIFRVLPGSLWVILGMGGVYAVLVLWLVLAGVRARAPGHTESR